MKRLFLTLLTALATCIGYVAPSSATILTYTFAASPSCCGAGPFGTVTLNDHSVSGSVDVTVHLFSASDGLIDTGAGDPLLFNLAGDPLLTAANISALTTGFAFNPGTHPGSHIHADGTGDWEYSIVCPGCDPGGSDPFFSDLTFTLTLAGLTVDSFVATTGSDGNVFAADLCYAFGSGPNGGCLTTGDITTSGSTPPQRDQAPEPGTLLLLGIGLLSAVGARRKPS